MAFLYSSYIIVYAVAGSLLGKYVDTVFREDQNITRALTNVGGVQFTFVSPSPAVTPPLASLVADLLLVL